MRFWLLYLIQQISEVLCYAPLNHLCSSQSLKVGQTIKALPRRAAHTAAAKCGAGRAAKPSPCAADSAPTHHGHLCVHRLPGPHPSGGVAQLSWLPRGPRLAVCCSACGPQLVIFGLQAAPGACQLADGKTLPACPCLPLKSCSVQCLPGACYVQLQCFPSAVNASWAADHTRAGKCGAGAQPLCLGASVGAGKGSIASDWPGH